MAGLLAGLPLAAAAGAAAPTATDVFDSIGPSQGMPAATVNGARETREGYLWLATGSGLLRYDGVRFTSFRPANTPALPDPLILALAEDRQGDLWIGTASGVVRRHGGVFQRLGLAGLSVASLAEDRQGRMWIGTHEQGLFCWEDGHLRPATEAALPDPFVTCLACDTAGAVWVGLGAGGVLHLQDGQAQRLFTRGEAGDHVGAVAEYPAGTMWLGSHDGRLYRVRLGELTQVPWEKPDRPEAITGLVPALRGGLWVTAGGLHRVADPNDPMVRPVEGCPLQNLAGVYEDREGNLWLCGREDGLMRDRRVPYRLLGTDAGLPGLQVRTVAAGPASLWAGIYREGMVRLDADDRPSVFSLAGWVPRNDPSVVFPSADGGVWVGGPGPLHHRAADGTVTTAPQVRGVRGIFRDRAGAFWFGTDDSGLFCWRDGEFHPVTRGGAAIEHATAFAEDARGDLWVGSWSQGLYRIHGDVVQAVDAAGGLPSREVRALLVDAEGRLWVGFRSRGLTLYEGGQWHASPSLSELVADHVSGLVEDGMGHLWLGTAAGIFWAEKTQLADACRRGASAPLHRAGVGGGEVPLQAWSGAQPVAARLADGRVAFATRQGIFLADPRRLPADPVPPAAVIEGVTADQADLDPAGPVVLAPGTRQLIVGYTAPGFVDAARMSFRYRLVGYDRDWVEAGDRRAAVYGSLPPGRYRLLIQAANGDGVWNEPGPGLAVEQRPWFYQTRAFVAALLAAAALAAFGLYRWSHRRLQARLAQLEQRQAMERERGRIAKHLHDDLGASLTEIGLFAEAARRRQSLPAAIEDMSVLSQRVREAVGSLDAIVWAVNPANDSLDQLAAYLSEYFQQLFSRSAIRCRLDIADDIPATPLSPDARSDLFLTAKEAMHNVLKHSGASEARLEMSRSDGGFRLAVVDDGRGFDPGRASPRRNGLANMRSRVASLGGQLRIVSAPGEGTRVILFLPSCPPPSPSSKTTPPLPPRSAVS